MPAHDPEHNPAAPFPGEEPPRSTFPEEVARTAQGSVSTDFEPGTGPRLKRGAAIAAAILALGFVAVGLLRYLDYRSVAKASQSAYSAPPPVDIVVARPVTVGQGLVLPGQTAAWFESTIYARVNGYVAQWLVDIGDHVKKDQVLALIETPELDAELAKGK